jgi:hypothetical protein
VSTWADCPKKPVAQSSSATKLIEFQRLAGYAYCVCRLKSLCFERSIGVCPANGCLIRAMGVGLGIKHHTKWDPLQGQYLKFLQHVCTGNLTCPAVLSSPWNWAFYNSTPPASIAFAGRDTCHGEECSKPRIISRKLQLKNSRKKHRMKGH